MFRLPCDISTKKELPVIMVLDHTREKNKLFDLGGICTHNQADVNQISAWLGSIVDTGTDNI